MSNFAQAEDPVLDSLYNALSSSKTAEDKATYLNDIGTIYCVRGEFSTGAKYVLESIKILEALGDTSRLCRRYLNMGNMFSTIDQTAKGIGYLNKSIQLSTIKQDTFILATALNNLGSVYDYIGQPDSALYYCEKARVLHRLMNDPISLARTIMAIGKIYDGTGEVQQGLNTYYEALAMIQPYTKKEWPTHKQMQLDVTLETLYGNVGTSYLALGDIDSALKYLERVVNFDSDFSSMYLRKHAHWSIAESYEIKGNYKASLDHYKWYSILSDSLLNQGKIETINEMTIKYETDKKELENSALRQKNDIIEQNSALKDEKIWIGNILIFVIVFFALVLTIVLVFLMIRNNLVRKLNLELEQKNEALKLAKQKHELKALLNQINPHFIFNALNSIQQFIIQNDTKASFEYFNRFGNLIRSSLEHSRLKFVVINEEIDVIQNYVTLENLRFEDDITLKIETSNVDIFNAKIPPMFIQPLIENAIIHGLSKKSGPKEIKIEFKESEEAISCTITDNGIGRTNTLKNHDHERNSGLTITKGRLESIWMQKKSNMEIYFDDLVDENYDPIGTRVVINLPKSF